MCVLGQPEPVGSVLMFLSGYDTLEYFWVKATAVSVRLRILFVKLQNTNTAILRLTSYTVVSCSAVQPDNSSCKYRHLQSILPSSSTLEASSRPSIHASEPRTCNSNRSALLLIWKHANSFHANLHTELAPRVTTPQRTATPSAATLLSRRR